MKTAIATNENENPVNITYIMYDPYGGIKSKMSPTMIDIQRATIVIKLNTKTGEVLVVKNRLSP